MPPQKKKYKKPILFLQIKIFTDFYLNMIIVFTGPEIFTNSYLDLLLTIYHINCHVNLIFSITNNLSHQRGPNYTFLPGIPQFIAVR